MAHLSRTSFFARFPRPLIAILALSALILFFRLSHVDMVGDDAHYSVRAIAPVDFMFGEIDAQSTPLQWFPAEPWWARLSFHDHPKTLIWVQHFFLSIHQSIFFAKVPYALFALGTLCLMYFFIRRLEPRAALIGVGLLALNAHFIWVGRVAYLESGVIFCILLALYYFVRFEENRGAWWKFGLALGLALSTKFTTLFLVPAFLLYWALNRRSIFREPKLYLAGAVALLLQLPLFLYNGLMYRATGHFALQFARLFKQPSPWHLSGVDGFSILGFKEIFVNLGHQISWPYLILFVAAIGYTMWWKRRLTILLSLIGFFTFQQIFIGRGGYVLSMYAIFIAPLLALSLVHINDHLAVRYGARVARGGQIAVALVGVYLLFFVVQSEVLPQQYGVLGWTYSEAVSKNYGVAQLDEYLDTLAAKEGVLTRLDPYGEIKIKNSQSAKYLLKTNKEALVSSLEHATIVLFDDRISWFSRVWLFERRRFYQNLPVISIAENQLLDQLKLDSFYFIKAEAGAPLDSVVKDSPLSPAMEEKLIKLGLTPEYIYRDDGRLAFKIYHVVREEK